MNAIQVRCPQCGATLKAGDAARVICEYCGTEAHVQRRSQVLQRPVPPPRALPSDTRYAVQVRTASWASIGVVLGAIAVCGVGITCIVKRAVEAQQRKAMTRGGGTTEAPGRMLGWEGDSGGGALMIDADADGDLDVVGRCREYNPKDAVSLIALDGKTGATIWETEPLGTYIETYQGVLTAMAGVIVFADERAHLRAFVAGGAPLWTATLPERVDRFCQALNLTLVAVGKDGVSRGLRLDDGKPSDAEATDVAPTCLPLPHDHDGGDLTSVRVDAPYDLLTPHGLSTGDLVTGPTGARVLGGRRAKGTGVPTLVAIDDQGAQRWRADIPAEPLAAAEGEPDLIVVGADVTCASYELTASGALPHVVCFELATGARRWDAELLDDSPLEGLFVTDAGVMIAQWGLLEVRDPADGKLRWKFGGV